MSRERPTNTIDCGWCGCLVVALFLACAVIGAYTILHMVLG